MQPVCSPSDLRAHFAFAPVPPIPVRHQAGSTVSFSRADDDDKKKAASEEKKGELAHEAVLNQAALSDESSEQK